jgi:hypothetical protein
VPVDLQLERTLAEQIRMRPPDGHKLITDQSFEFFSFRGHGIRGQGPGAGGQGGSRPLGDEPNAVG